MFKLILNWLQPKQREFQNSLQTIFYRGEQFKYSQANHSYHRVENATSLKHLFCKKIQDERWATLSGLNVLAHRSYLRVVSSCRGYFSIFSSVSLVDLCLERSSRSIVIYTKFVRGEVTCPRLLLFIRACPVFNAELSFEESVLFIKRLAKQNSLVVYVQKEPKDKISFKTVVKKDEPRFQPDFVETKIQSTIVRNLNRLNGAEGRAYLESVSSSRFWTPDFNLSLANREGGGFSKYKAKFSAKMEEDLANFVPNLAQDAEILKEFFSIENPGLLRKFFTDQSKLGRRSILFLPSAVDLVVLHLKIILEIREFGVESIGFPVYEPTGVGVFERPAVYVRGFDKKLSKIKYLQIKNPFPYNLS